MDVTSDAGAVIIGGGITGLTAAYRLRQLAPDLPITLIERESRLGGKIATERSDDFILELGPDSFLATKPRGVGLCQELGLAEDLQGTRQETRGSFVLHGGRLYPLPEGLTGLIPTRFGPIVRTRLLTPRGKLRLGLDFVLPRRRDDRDESLASFIQRRLGRQAYERLVEPLMTGIYGGDGTRLSLAATFPQLRQAERDHGGLIKGLIAARHAAGPTKSGVSSRAGFLTPRTGMAAITDALETRLRQSHVNLRTSTLITAVIPAADGTSGYSIRSASGAVLSAAAVIVCTPAFVSAELLAPIDEQLSALLREIPYTSTAIATLAFNQSDLAELLRGHGYVVPRIEQRPVLACTWTSSKWASRAPDGTALLRVFLGRTAASEITELPDERLLQLALEEVRATLGITAAPNLVRISRWPKAMPQYEMSHLDLLAALDRLLAAHPALALAGAAYRGVGIPDCIASGELAAARVLAALTRKDGTARANPRRLLFTALGSCSWGRSRYP